MGSVIPNTKRTDLIHFNPKDLIIVGLDTKHGADHTLYDERVNIPLSEEMVLDIMVQGVLQSIQVVRNGAHYEVINGRRRVLHAREANKRLIERGEPPILVPAVIKSGLDDAALIGALISTNEHVLPDGILVKAAKASRAVNKCGMSLAETAIKFGVNADTIRRWLKLNEMSQPVKDAIIAEKISAAAALVLSDVPREEQPAKLAAILGSQTTLKKELDAASNETPDVKPPSKRDVIRLIDAPPSPREIKALLKADAKGDIYLDKPTLALFKQLAGVEPLSENLKASLKIVRES